MSDAMPPARREPVFNLPGVVVACIAVLLGLYAAYAAASDETQIWLVDMFGFVPARVSIALGVAQGALQAAAQNLPQDTLAQVVGSGGGRWWTLVTYAFLHGSWAHVGFNCLWLAAFGAPVARRFGAARFLALLLAAAVVGALAQYAAGPASFVPVIGASGAVAGAMGAAVRFVFRPSSEAMAMLDRREIEAGFALPALSLTELVRTKAALLFILVWFGTNLLFGLYPSLSGVSDGPIAWQAHIGGFLAGLLAFPLFDPRRPVPEPEMSANLPLEDPHPSLGSGEAQPGTRGPAE